LNHPEYALIVAGGKGTRIKSTVPKQFIELNGLPVLCHTINAFFRYSEKIKVILVLPKEEFEVWEAIVKKYHFTYPVVLQEGGSSRFQSVKKGLEKIEGDGLVAIHDGVRPLISPDIIKESFRLAAKHQSAVAAMPLKESIRILERDQTKAMDRAQFRLIQTPQTFQVSLIKKAYTTKEDNALTDDASVAERNGHSIFLFEGSYRNLKITTEEDLVIAEALLKDQL
jgi:2-C-methyl-D-erythritol 4-phosphate cytidylyltransferase